MIAKIGLEEHYITPDFVDYWRTAVRGIDEAFAQELIQQMSEVGEERIAIMDAAGIEMAVLSSAGSVLLEPDAVAAVKVAATGNDELAEIVSTYPERFAGFAMLPLQDPRAAADELERSVRELGFKGAMVFGHVHGRYLDEDEFSPVWERAQDLDVPIYLHPTGSYVIPQNHSGRPQLLGPVWNWTEETATHALRLVFGGVFERYPRARLILGHMGETLPYLLWRLDSRHAFVTHGRPSTLTSRPPSWYITHNITVTTAGVCAPAALRCALAELGDDSVMFSTDYPFEDIVEAADFADSTPMDGTLRTKICYDNAKRILRLP